MKKSNNNANATNNQSSQQTNSNIHNKSKQSFVSHRKINAVSTGNSTNRANTSHEKKRPQTYGDKNIKDQNANNIQGNFISSNRQDSQSASNLKIGKSKNELENFEIYELEKQTFVLSSDDQNIINLVNSFLDKRNCISAKELFIQEIYRPSNPYNKKLILFQSLIQAFESGERDLFFLKWNKIPHKQQLPNQINKLEFYLQVYFFIYEIHPLFNSKDKISSEKIDHFRKYLESKGTELSKTTELLSFYALPYIQKPADHNGFKQLFTKEWIEHLKNKLCDYLDNFIRDQESLSELELLYYSSTHLYSPPTQQLLQQNQQELSIESNYHDSKKKQQQPVQDKAAYLQQRQMSPSQENSNIEDNMLPQMNEISKRTLEQEFNSRYNNLQNLYFQVQEQAKQAIMESHYKWFKIGQDLLLLSKELFQMLEGAFKGALPNLSVFEVKKIKLNQFEHFLSSNIEDLIHQSQDISLFEKQISFLEGEQSSLLVPQNKESIYHPGKMDQIKVDSHFQEQNKEQQLSIQNQPIKNNNQQQDGTEESYYQNEQFLESQEQAIQEEQQQSYVPINFQKIKEALKSNLVTFSQKTCILQALRWRISRTNHANLRREVILAYALHDILGCTENDITLQNGIFNSSYERLTDLRLVNALASDFEGRTYLVQSQVLVNILITILKREKEDTNIRKKALGSLQKLSLRRKPQIFMIQNDLIKWIVDTLRNERDQLSEYSYEYATALFMNLSLRSLGRDKCQDEKLGALEVLFQLLEHENEQVRTFVNGTLYSLLGRQALREQSKKLSLLQYLVHLKNNTADTFNKQLQYLINQLTKEYDQDDEENDSNLEEGNEDDIEDEEIEVDEEDDQDEHIEYIDTAESETYQQMIGENLLIQQFNLRGSEALRQRNLMKSALEDSKRNELNLSVLSNSRSNNRPEPFNRPATPSLSISQLSQIVGGQESKRSKNNINNVNTDSEINNEYYQQLEIVSKPIVDQDKHQIQKMHQQQQMQQQQKQQQNYLQNLNQPTHGYQSQVPSQQQLLNLPSNDRQNQEPSQQRLIYDLGKQQHDKFQRNPLQTTHQQNTQQDHSSIQQQKKSPNKEQESKLPSDSKSSVSSSQNQINQNKNQQQPFFNQNNNQSKQTVSNSTKEAFAPRPKIPRTPPSLKEQED